jgi:hypothetical protein
MSASLKISAVLCQLRRSEGFVLCVVDHAFAGVWSTSIRREELVWEFRAIPNYLNLNRRDVC